MGSVAAVSTGPLPRGRHGLSREQVEASQRLRLAVAMAEVCAEDGYSSVSVKHVLERAGVSRLTFYELYSNKLDCFLEALDLVGAVLVSQLRTEAGVPGDGSDRPLRPARVDAAVAGLDTYLDDLADNIAFARLYIVEAHAAGPEALRRRADLQARVTDGLAVTLGARSAADRFACTVFVSAVASVVTMPIVDRDLDALAAVRDPLVGELRALAERIC